MKGEVEDSGGVRRMTKSDRRLGEDIHGAMKKSDRRLGEDIHVHMASGDRVLQRLR
jgi:hypothetical protein